jgi:hypothetical protein
MATNYQKELEKLNRRDALLRRLETEDIFQLKVDGDKEDTFFAFVPKEMTVSEIYENIRDREFGEATLKETEVEKLLSDNLIELHTGFPDSTLYRRAYCLRQWKPFRNKSYNRNYK